MKQATLILGLAALAAALAPAPAGAHCQVPCGIYDDAARVARLYEDAATIEKGMQMIAELAGQDDAQSRNQLVRWVMTKEEHAAHVIEVVAEYFLAQRVKPVAPEGDGRAEYLERVAAHHAVITAAMKCKQNTDPLHVAKLRAALDGIAGWYPPAPHEH